MTFLVLYTFAIPASMLWALSDAHPFPWRERVAYLTEPYTATCWWWEFVEMTRRFVLCGTLIFASPGSALQPMIGLLVALAFLLTQLWLAPFRSAQLELINLTSQLCALVALLYAVAASTTILNETGISSAALDGAMFVSLLLPLVVGLVMISPLISPMVAAAPGGGGAWGRASGDVTLPTGDASGAVSGLPPPSAQLACSGPSTAPRARQLIKPSPVRSRVQCNWTSERPRRKIPGTSDGDRQMFV